MAKYRKIPNNKIVYPNMEKWIKQNCKSIFQFSLLTGISDRACRNILYGRHMPNKYTIDIILETTSLTYEVAFAGEDSK